MPILNYTTKVQAGKTATEVVTILAKHGASTVASYYEAGEPSGIAFTIDTQYGPRDFRLPANVPGVAAAMQKQRARGLMPNTAQARDPGQPGRVAWRILKDWIEAQLAIIEAGMATLDEVMLPYMVVNGATTVAQVYQKQRGRLAIEATDVIDAEIVQ